MLQRPGFGFLYVVVIFLSFFYSVRKVLRHNTSISRDEKRRQKVDAKRDVVPLLPERVSTKLFCQLLILNRQDQLVYQHSVVGVKFAMVSEV